jgi:hypothetical protein
MRPRLQSPLKLLVILGFSLFALGARANPVFFLSKQKNIPLRAEDFAGVKLAVQYGYGPSRPARAETHIRTDKYTLQGGGLNPWDVVDVLGLLPVGYHLDEGAELLFVRPFPTLAEAKAAKPYGPDRLPLTAARALEKLKPGDFVSFEAEMHLLLSAKLSLLIVGGLNVSGAKEIGMRGKFLVQIYRLSEDRVRIRLLSLSGKKSGLVFGSSYHTPLEYFGFNPEATGDVVEKIGLTPIRLSRRSSKDDTIAVDATFRLNDSEAAAAYDGLMRSTLVNAKGTDSPLRLHDLRAAEKIYQSDVARSERDRRVTFNLNAEAKTKSVTSGLVFNALLAAWKYGMVFSSTEILDRTSGSKTIFDFSASRMVQQSVLGLMPRAEVHSVGIVSTEKQEKIRFRSEWKGSRLSPDVITAARKDMSLLSPAMARMGWQRIPKSEFPGTLEMQITFSPEALQILGRTAGRKMEAEFREFLTEMELSGLVPYYTPLTSGDGSHGSCSTIDCFESDLKALGKLIPEALKTGASRAERSKRFADLMEFSIFQRYGGAFLAARLPLEQRSQLIGLGIRVKTKDAVLLEVRDPQWTVEFQSVLDFIESMNLL